MVDGAVEARTGQRQLDPTCASGSRTAAPHTSRRRGTTPTRRARSSRSSRGSRSEKAGSPSAVTSSEVARARSAHRSRPACGRASPRRREHGRGRARRAASASSARRPSSHSSPTCAAIQTSVSGCPDSDPIFTMSSASRSPSSRRPSPIARNASAFARTKERRGRRARSVCSICRASASSASTPVAGPAREHVQPRGRHRRERRIVDALRNLERLATERQHAVEIEDIGLHRRQHVERRGRARCRRPLDAPSRPPRGSAASARSSASPKSSSAPRASRAGSPARRCHVRQPSRAPPAPP